MLAAVYSMQAVARLLAFGVCLAALHIISSRNNLSPDVNDEKYSLMKKVVDQVWRWVTGIAIIPAAFAIVLRLTIPETPRYYADIRRDIGKAMKRVLKVYGEQPPEDRADDVSVDDSDDEISQHDNDGADDDDHWYKGAWKYLRTTPAGKNLVLIAGLWAIMDFGWYGLSMDSPSALSTLWHDPSVASAKPTTVDLRRSAESNCPEFNNWRTDRNPNTTIYRVLENNSIRSMLVVSIGSLLGNIGLILIINRFRRKRILMTTFILLGLLFAITGGSLIGTYRAQHNHRVSTVFFGIMHFVFTIGPKTLILILAVEMFPTIYRGTFYGIAASVGKIGAIIIRAITGRTGNGEMALGIRLIAVIPLMFLGAWMSSQLPDVQHVQKGVDAENADEESDNPEPGGFFSGGLRFFKKLQNMTLEEIAPSPALSLARRGRKGAS